MTMSTDTDRIERSIFIASTRERVWQSLTDAASFGAWFGADLQGQSFAPGQRVRGPITTPGYEHLFFDAVVDSIAPRDSMSFHWHPYAGDPAPEPPEGPPTLVRFTLADSPGGILLTVVESGFDRLPAARRGLAFASHAEGWDIQLRNVERHVLGE